MDSCKYCDKEFGINAEYYLVTIAVKPPRHPSRTKRTGEKCCEDCYESGCKVTFDKWKEQNDR